MNNDELEEKLKTTPTLKVGTLDVSSWTEFGDFFDKPLSKRTNQNFLIQMKRNTDSFGNWVSGDYIQVMLKLGFIAFTSDNQDKAIMALRNELLKIHKAPDAVVRGFLAKPSVIKLARCCKDGETPDRMGVIDLSGEKPLKQYYSAFCFIHGYLAYTILNTGRGFSVISLDENGLEILGVKHTQEGHIGFDLDI